MKSSLASMVVACEEFLGTDRGPNGRISFLLTSDEEGPATDGTVAVVDVLKARQTNQANPRSIIASLASRVQKTPSVTWFGLDVGAH